MSNLLWNIFEKRVQVSKKMYTPIIDDKEQIERNRKMESQQELFDLTEEYQKSIIPETIKSEVNFLTFPFFALSTKGLKKKTKTEYREVIKRGDERLEILWNVSANMEYGYPGPFDREVHKTIEQIISEILQKDGKITNPIALGSLYQICKRMGNDKFGGSQYRKIKDALERIKTTSVKSKGAFYNKGRKEWVEDIFGLYDRIVFKGKTLPNGEIADTNYLFLGSWYIESINAFYVKPLDYKYLRSLNSLVASRLYEILGVRFYGLQRRNQPHIWFNYQILCQLLPIEPQKYFSMAKQKLQLAHEELIRTHFLSKVEWQQKSTTEWVIYYYPGKRAKEELKKNWGVSSIQSRFDSVLDCQYSPEKMSDNVENEELVLMLTERGISENIGKQLVIKYPIKISEKVEIFDWMKKHDPEKIKDNAAYLRRMIEEDWPAPEGFILAKDKDVKLHALKEELRKRIKEAKIEAEKWANMLPEERISGRLNFWIDSEKRFNQHQPTEEEISAKKEELISFLPTKEEYEEQLIDEIKKDIKEKEQRIQ
jgi:hypothetical protein